MNELIKNEIEAFESLQQNYDSVGADDSEPDYIFQLLISHAITKKAIDREEAIEWELVGDEIEMKKAASELTAQAWKVYDAIGTHATAADIDELKDYCWRIYDV